MNLMSNVVTRSFVLLAVSTAIVLVSAFVAPPGDPSHTMVASTESGDMAGHDMSGMDMAVDSEEAFITGMIPHHQEAVESAQAVLETTERPEIRDFAQEVIAVQTEEIALLASWRERNYPDASPADYAPMMRDPAGLNSDEADRAFLEGMIVHHQGAIDMAQSYLDADFEKQDKVVQLAEAIVNAQTGEIAQMQGWLNEWYGGTDADHSAH